MTVHAIHAIVYVLRDKHTRMNTEPLDDRDQVTGVDDEEGDDVISRVPYVARNEEGRPIGTDDDYDQFSANIF